MGSIIDFNFFCCPECVYRSKEELTFQAHALQNHVLSKTFFHSVEDHNTDHANELENSEVGNDAMEDFEEKFEANEDDKQFEIHQNDQELEDTNEDLQVKEEELEIEPDIPIEDDLQGD